MKRYVIIVAGGSGTRMNSAKPKQFLSLNGLPILQHTINAFINYDPNINIIVVLPEVEITSWCELCKKHQLNQNYIITAGGKTRFHSVKNGLVHIKEDALIAIHDGVRPLVSLKTIENAFNTAKEKGNAIPVILLKDSLRQIKDEQSVAVNRADYRIVQTPQVFKSKNLHEAYKQDFQSYFTDDASVIESLGEKIHLTVGNYENIKITTPEDFKIAACFLKESVDNS